MADSATDRPTHPWNDPDGDGHNCADCPTESIWKCDPAVHPLPWAAQDWSYLAERDSLPAGKGREVAVMDRDEAMFEEEVDLGVTPDELVSRLFKLQNESNPDEDPGDLTIDVQDDSAMTAVFQKGKMIGVGGSIQAALESAVSGGGKPLDVFPIGPATD